MGPPRFVVNVLRFGSMYDHIGQDTTGFSTPALGSILTSVAIVLGKCAHHEAAVRAADAGRALKPADEKSVAKNHLSSLPGRPASL